MPSHSPESSDPSSENSALIPKQVKVVLAVLVSTAFIMLLNETTLAVALPAIMEDYAIPAETAQWLLTGFMLTMAVVLPTTGWLLERFTTRSVFVFASACFLFGTILAAVAPTFAVMLAARVAQAIATAVIMPLLMTVTMTMVPFQRRGTVMGLIGIVMATGPALGPTVAGAVLSFTTWHGIFWVMVPLGAIAGVIGTAKLTNIGEPRSTPFDLLSVLLSAVAFGGLIYGLSTAATLASGGAGGEASLIALGSGVVGLGLFVWRQRALSPHGRALLNLEPLANRNYTLSLVVLVTLFGAMLGVVSTLPLYMQGSLLVSALVAGLVLLPGGLLEAVLSPIAGRLYDVYGPRPLIVPGMLLTVGSLFALVFVTEHTSVIFIIAMHVVFSVALALLFTPLMTTALSSLSQPLYSHGSAILSTLQQLAGAAGTAAMIGVYSGVTATAEARGSSEPAALAQGASSAFLVATILAAVALVLSFFIKRLPRDLAPTTSPTQ
ncbi:MAG: multidrug efflux MFS transporter [Microbacteriaceae bacterium]|nr:multidrug efflux MFS transporter [Microbacteriaceae bacterium]